MILEFKTPRNVNGIRRYLAINTDNNTFTQRSPSIIIDGLEIKKRDYSALINQLKENGFKETN